MHYEAYLERLELLQSEIHISAMLLRAMLRFMSTRLLVFKLWLFAKPLSTLVI